jgi:uracil-DNA glycosylase
MIIGEQPGDAEDLSGRPFVGPTGELLRMIAAEAKLDLTSAYMTNAVKHFKFIAHGKERLHQRPNPTEIKACQSWLRQEQTTVQPHVILTLGATALLAVTGDGTDIAGRRGKIEITNDGVEVFVTFHPSYILRLPDRGAKANARALFANDLQTLAAHIRA